MRERDGGLTEHQRPATSPATVEAVKAGEELLAQRRKLLGPEHKDTSSAIYNLGISLRIAGRAEESIKMLQDCVELHRKVLGPKDSATLATMQALADSCDAAGRKDQAAKLRAELEALKQK